MFAGAVGGLIGPGRGGALDYAGNEPLEKYSWEASDALGQTLASRVLEAVDSDQLETLDAPELGYASQEFLATVDNTVFVLAASIGLVPRGVYNTARLSTTSFSPPAQVLTEVATMRLGPITLFTAPGEVFPETLVGGFPGKPTANDPVLGDVNRNAVDYICDEMGLPAPGGDLPCLVKPDQTNPPDWSATPDPPYVYERAPGRYTFFIGLGQDALGYLVPDYDYEATNYFNQAPGSHYEETNGVGRDIEQRWQDTLQQCFEAMTP